MMIVEINSVNYGSTGNIMLQIAQTARAHGYSVTTCCAKSRSNLKRSGDNQLFIGNVVSRHLHYHLGKVTGFKGCFSVIDTLIYCSKLSKLKPNLVHLHNLHDSFQDEPKSQIGKAISSDEEQ